MTITNFLDSYLEFTKTTVAAPELFHKWAARVAISSMLGKRFWIARGHLKVYSNLYVMLMGEPGTGKGLACDLIQNTLVNANYEYFAADRSSKEMFFQDLADGLKFNSGGDSLEGLLANQLYGGGAEAGESEPRECLIIAEEFNDFIGPQNLDFIAFLTKVWSYTGTYRYRLKTGRSVAIPEPCINLLGGNTSANFSIAFPPEIMGQGFLARLILVGGEFSGTRVSFPTSEKSSISSELSFFLQSIRANCHGEITLSERTFHLLDLLNQSFGGVEDPRFKDYNVRRFTQLLKLCIIECAARGSRELRISDIERADELLRETEHLMPKALGAFGKSRNADVANKILQVLYNATRAIPTMELWRIVCDDLDKISDLSDILSKLQTAHRIQSVNGGWLPKLIPKREAPIDPDKLVGINPKKGEEKK